MRAVSRPVPPGSDEPAFEIKGTVSSLTVLRLRAADLGRIEADLATRVTPHPQIFLHAPVVVDAGLIEEPLAWADVVRLLRAARLVPVGVAGLTDPEPAVAAGLGVIQLGSRLRSVGPEDSTPPVPASASTPPPVPGSASASASAPPASASAPPAPAPPAPAPEGARPPMTVSTPVRGGQVTYARGSDLVVIASVNPGAQVIADGSVMIWGPLRGRALAGAQGKKDARILCLALEAELVSVAGEYLMAEEIPDPLRGKPAQVFLDGDRVRIAPL